MNGMLPYHATKVRGTPAAIQTLLDYLAWYPTTTTFGAGYISDPGWTKPLSQGGKGGQVEVQLFFSPCMD